MDDLAQRALDAWRFPSPRTVAPISIGATNRTLLVTSPGPSAILRLISPQASVERITDEHAILGALSAAQLPFAVPHPLPTADGRTLVEVQPEDGFATLFAQIPGQSRSVIDAHLAREAGAALGILDRALADVRGVARPAFAATIDPSVELPIASELADRVRRLLAGIQASNAALPAELPRQIVHADLDPSNILFLGDRVSGMLDFEFAGWAPRAMDFAVALQGFAGFPRDSPTHWEIVDALTVGYCQQIDLSRDEIAAIPDLMRFRQAISLMLRVNRRATVPDLTARAERLLQLDETLTTHGDTLVGRISVSRHRR